jgi:transcriptional regulator with XRE-family HTH domain
MLETPGGPEQRSRLATLIVDAQVRADLSQEAAARAAGISVSAYRKIIVGETRPQERTLRRLAAGLGADLNELLDAGGFAPASETAVYTDVARDALDREERVVGKVDQFLSRYEELGHTYQRLDERTATLERSLADLHKNMGKRARMLDKRLNDFEAHQNDLSERLAGVERLLEEIATAVRGGPRRSGR